MTHIFMKAYGSTVDYVWDLIEQRRQEIYEREMELLMTQPEAEIKNTSDYLMKQTDEVSRKLAYRSRALNLMHTGVKAAVWLVLLISFVGFMGRHSLTFAARESLATAVSWLLGLGVLAVLSAGVCRVARSRYCEFLVKSIAVQQILEAEFDLTSEEIQDTNAFAVLAMSAFRFAFVGDDLAPYYDHEIITDQVISSDEFDEEQSDESDAGDGSA